MKYYDIIIRVKVLRGEIDEHIAGIKEDTALRIEESGAGIIGMLVKEVPTQQPKQLAFQDIAAAPKTDPPPAMLAEKSDGDTSAGEPPRPQKQKKERLTPNVPTWEQVLNYCRERRDKGKGMTDDAAEAWFDDCCTKKWHYGRNMTPVLDWKAHFRTGERHQANWERARAAREAKAVEQQGYAPSFDLPAFEQSTLVVPVFEKG